MPTTTASDAARRSLRRRRCSQSATRGKPLACGASVNAETRDELRRPRRSRTDRRRTTAPARRRARAAARPHAARGRAATNVRVHARDQQQRTPSQGRRVRRDLCESRKEEGAAFAQLPRLRLAREAGVRPARSRHCMRGAARTPLSSSRMGRLGHTAAIRESGYRRKRRTHNPPRAKERIAMFPTIVAAIVAASSLARRHLPPPVPQIAHVVTSDRSFESARANRAHDLRRDRRADRAQRRPHRRRRNRSVPGVNVVRYGAFGAATSVGIRGSSTQQILVLVDGLPIAGRPDQQRQSRAVLGQRASIASKSWKAAARRSTAPDRSAASSTSLPHRSPPRSDATLSTGSFGEQTYHVSNAVRFVPAHVRRRTTTPS